MPIKVFWLIAKQSYVLDAIAREIICYSNYFSPMLLTRHNGRVKKYPLERAAVALKPAPGRKY